MHCCCGYMYFTWFNNLLEFIWQLWSFDKCSCICTAMLEAYNENVNPTSFHTFALTCTCTCKFYVQRSLVCKYLRSCITMWTEILLYSSVQQLRWEKWGEKFCCGSGGFGRLSHTCICTKILHSWQVFWWANSFWLRKQVVALKLHVV